MGRDSATFQDKGTEVPSLSREKGKKGQKFLHCLGTKRQQDELKILLRDGTGFLHLPLSRDKGTAGQAQNLAKGRDGPGQPKFGTGRAGIAKNRDGTRDKTGQNRKGCFKIGKLRSKTENDVL